MPFADNVYESPTLDPDAVVLVSFIFRLPRGNSLADRAMFEYGITTDDSVNRSPRRSLLSTRALKLE